MPRCCYGLCPSDLLCAIKGADFFSETQTPAVGTKGKVFARILVFTPDTVPGEYKTAEERRIDYGEITIEDEGELVLNTQIMARLTHRSAQIVQAGSCLIEMSRQHN